MCFLFLLLFFFPLLFVFFCRFFDFFSFLFLAAEAPQTFNNNTGRGGGERAGQSDGGRHSQTPNVGTPGEGNLTIAISRGFAILSSDGATEAGGERCEGSQGLWPVASVGIFFFFLKKEN